MKFISTKKILLPEDSNLYGAAPVLASQSNDAWYILTLMRQESKKLGFIPIQAILQRIHTYDAVIWQHDHNNRRIGYLIHSKPQRESPLKVFLTVIDLDHRRRYWATQAVAKLIKKAYEYDAPEISLRCAHDLEANLFWRAIGFREISRHPNCATNYRDIITYSLPRQHFNHIRHNFLLQIPQLPYLPDAPQERRRDALPAPRALTRPGAAE